MKNNTLNYLTLIIVIVACPVLIVSYLNSDARITIFTYIGLLLMIPSLVLFTIARIQLGSSFQVSAKANKLVTNGIYKKIRHPVYLFGFIFILGVIVFIQQFYLLIICCGLIFIQMRRIRNEEKVLEERFGEHYVNYKKNTWF